MADDTSDTLLGALVQMIAGLVIMGFSLILLVALLGVAVNFVFGSSPGMLQPFGGTLVGFLISLVQFLTNVAIIVVVIVMVYLLATEQLDEMIDDMLNENHSSQSRQHASKSDQPADTYNKIYNKNNMIKEDNNKSNATDLTDVSTNEYGELEEY